MGQPSPAWHPKIAAIHDYWESRRPTPELLPGRAALDPTDIPNLLPDIFMLDVLEHPLRFRYRLVGSKLVMAGGRELTGRLMEQVHANLFTSEPYAHYPACVRDHQIGWRRGSTVFDWGREHVVIERIVLPLASDGRNVDIVLGLSVLFDSAGREL